MSDHAGFPSVPVIRLSLALCEVSVTERLVMTRLPDGGVVYGEPHDSAAYVETAERLGYGGDVARLNRCHEVGHSLLAHMLGLPASPTFERLAAGVMDGSEVTALEEQAVTAIEAFANAVGIDLVEAAQPRIRFRSTPTGPVAPRHARNAGIVPSHASEGSGGPWGDHDNTGGIAPIRV